MKVYISPSEMREAVANFAKNASEKPKSVEDFQIGFTTYMTDYEGDNGVLKGLSEASEIFINTGSRQIPPRKYIRENFNSLMEVFNDYYNGEDDDEEECCEEDEEPIIIKPKKTITRIARKIAHSSFDDGCGGSSREDTGYSWSTC